jgi:hypothetical protein
MAPSIHQGHVFESGLPRVHEALLHAFFVVELSKAMFLASGGPTFLVSLVWLLIKPDHTAHDPLHASEKRRPAFECTSPNPHKTIALISPLQVNSTNTTHTPHPPLQCLHLERPSKIRGRKQCKRRTRKLLRSMGGKARGRVSARAVPPPAHE